MYIQVHAMACIRSFSRQIEEPNILRQFAVTQTFNCACLLGYDSVHSSCNALHVTATPTSLLAQPPPQLQILPQDVEHLSTLGRVHCVQV
jgi:hypothetical protein